MSFVAGSRGLRILWQGATGWESWLAGALALLVCAACLRWWAQYLIISNRVVMRNGYTGTDIQTIRLDDIAEITLSQGPAEIFLSLILHAHLLPRCYQDRTTQPHLYPLRCQSGLLFLVGLGYLRLDFLKFVNRRSLVRFQSPAPGCESNLEPNQ